MSIVKSFFGGAMTRVFSADADEVSALVVLDDSVEIFRGLLCRPCDLFAEQLGVFFGVVGIMRFVTTAVAWL